MVKTGASVEWARQQVDLGRVPLAVLGIASSNGIEDVVAFGSDGGRQATVDNHFALFSVSKPISALAVMRQVELGKLSLGNALSTAVPGFGAGRTDTVTLEHLLSHRSGITDPELDDGVPLRDALTSAGQTFYAGSLVQYCNIAFEGAAAMAEWADGRPFEEQVLSLAADTGASGLTFSTDCNPHTVHGTEAEGLNAEAMFQQRHPGGGTLRNSDGPAQSRNGVAQGFRQGRPTSHPGSHAPASDHGAFTHHHPAQTSSPHRSGIPIAGQRVRVDRTGDLRPPRLVRNGVVDVP